MSAGDEARGDSGPLATLARGECHAWVHRRAQEPPGPGARGRRTEALRLVLRDLARRYLPDGDLTVERTCARCGGPHGRPVVVVDGKPSPLRVSVAHAGDTTVFAFSGSADVGVDIEVVRPDFDWSAMVDIVFSDAERRQTESSSPDAAVRCVGYYERWVAKEAVLKAMGVGLAGPLKDVDTTGGRTSTWNGWSMAPLAVDVPLVGALACAGAVHDIRMFVAGP